MKTLDQKTLLANGLKHLWGQDSLKKLCAENVVTLSDENQQALLCYISHLLIQPSLTEQVAKNFPQIVLQLLHIAKDWNKLQIIYRTTSPSLHIIIDDDESKRHKKICVALAKLIMFHPDALRFSLEYFEKYPAPFAHLVSPSEVDSSRAECVEEQISDYDIIVSCYSFLSASCDHFRQCWNWAAFSELLKRYKHNKKLMWVGLNCLATVTGMSDSERQYLLFDEKAESYLIQFDKYIEKLSNIKVMSSDILEAPSADSYSVPGSVITVAGFQFPVVDPTKQRDEPLQRGILTTEQNLRSLALALVSGRAVCLQGPVGSGKTALVEHFANLTGRVGLPHLTKIQLGDQTDSKILLGSYRCTDIPGEFVWQSGVLTEAVEKGYWLLLEDIDSAPSDLASVLASLLETRHLFVPGYRDSIPVARGFQLFLTRRFTKSGSEKISVSSSLLESHWVTVDIKPLKKEELLQVVRGMFPVLEHSAENLINTFSVFSQGRHGEDPEQTVKNPIKKRILEELKQKLGRGRLTSTRDLLKWALRCNKVYECSTKGNKEAALNIYADAVDIFCLSEKKKDVRIAGAKAVGSFLSVLVDADNYLNVHKPTISETDRQVRVGRATLLKKKTDGIALQHAHRIALVPPVVRLLEGVARAIEFCEPVLLVGETGTGKTFLVQHLAQRTGNPLLVINMNQQSETTDLLGGYKPMDLKFIVGPVREKFEGLVRTLAWEDDPKYLVKLAREYHSRNWKMLLLMMKRKTSSVLKKLRKKPDPGGEIISMISNWKQLGGELSRLEKQIASNAMAFTFVEGSLVRAVREGKWVLLDEINLAPPETLECLSGLLEDGAVGSLRLLERGDEKPVARHKDFRLFACMNPATDVGKKELPGGLRNRFTEFFVDELTSESDLKEMLHCYIGHLGLGARKIKDLVQFYCKLKNADNYSLCDGTGNKPHYSLRTLCRALTVAAKNLCGSVPRSLYEAFCMSFLTQLDYDSHPVVEGAIRDAVLSGKKDTGNDLTRQLPLPGKEDLYVCVEGFWIRKGTLDPFIPQKYILTPSVSRNLRDLARIVSLGRLPVLLQGDTSVGKTSIVTYLAQITGHHCVRINNHEHTDLQEYVGSYIADASGSLVFREGALAEAMRHGHWVILDELNLAPTDVLEALNRVLDDNRELFIPETQEVISAHPDFMLFATQNPPGLYGGRKLLSRAFRNRFVELHFDKIPSHELETILQKRCELPESYARRMVNVMRDLQVHRRSSVAFAGNKGYMTLRDLFRWGERYRRAPHSSGFQDWKEYMAEEGFLVLACRVRCKEEEEVIWNVIAKHFGSSPNRENLFSFSNNTSLVTSPILQKIKALSNKNPDSGIVWTQSMRRMAVLVYKAFEFDEPVLLVGETGCGKTTVVQYLAALQDRTLYMLNCHMHTEASDFLGGLRPVRHRNQDDDSPQKLFEWVDGPLIRAMEEGSWFLCDEISLADDSVLERLNSLLEPERKLLLSEKGSTGSVSSGVGDSSCVVVAAPAFKFVGTMNPGGDYGKKELSPALRNRLTEIWCGSHSKREDLEQILKVNQKSGLELNVSVLVMDFLDWFTSTKIGSKFHVNVRDLITWVNFYNVCTSQKEMSPALAYVHGAFLTFLDSFGSGVTSSESEEDLDILKSAAVQFLAKQVNITEDHLEQPANIIRGKNLCILPFSIETGPLRKPLKGFTFNTKTTLLNAKRVLRGLQLMRPILLEGSPGVGKTALVAALARLAGYRLVRINISEQTDISDLFGADLPVDGGGEGQFAWRDGPFLRALKDGDWILLDELNLASQSVLEGLNAVFDHRGEAFIPELGCSFKLKHQTRLFATQNPQRQGGARKGLPRSFLNRFTQVYISALTSADLEAVLSAKYPRLTQNLIHRMVQFNEKIRHETTVLGLWGQRGGPWELNLRDLSRWADAVVAGHAFDNPGLYLPLIYMFRMRTQHDREQVLRAAAEEGFTVPTCESSVTVTTDMLHVGETTTERLGRQIKLGRLCGSLEPHPRRRIHLQLAVSTSGPFSRDPLVLRSMQPALHSLLQCLSLKWMPILVGPSGCGKTTLVKLAAQLAGRELRILSFNSAMDTMEILGGFEQVDHWRRLSDISREVEWLVYAFARSLLLQDEWHGLSVLHKWHAFCQKTVDKEQQNNVKNFLMKVRTLEDIVTDISSSPVKMVPENSVQQMLENLVNKLTDLKSQVVTDGSLSVGGKFMWVDSILIKALKEGCWLLADNVNLCSPAVLDRLNALMEPGGKLVVDELGVNADGRVVTIDPHSKFRLIMTMDPQHGEISRAMRNRGVEIFIQTEEQYRNLDELSVLFRCGIKNYHHQSALLDVHHAVCSMLGVSDKTLHLSRLEQTASLLWHQLGRGHKALTALPVACYDVYTRAGGNSQFLQASIQQVLVEKLSRYRNFLKHGSHEDALLPLSALACPAPVLTTNTVFTGVKSSTAALLTVASNVELSSTTVPMVTGVDMPENSTDFLEELAFVLFSTGSYKGMQVANMWLQSKVQSSGSGILQPALQMYQKLSKSWKRLFSNSTVKIRLGLDVEGVDICDWKELPWDVRWLPFAEQRCSNVNHYWHDHITTVNGLHLLNYITYVSQKSERKAKTSGLTLLELSQKFTKGEVDTIHCQQLLLQKLYSVLAAINSCIVELVILGPEIFSDKNSLAEVMNGVMWIERFTRQGRHPVSKEGVRPSSIEMLALHFCWLRKHTIPLIANETLCRKIKAAEDLMMLIGNLNEVFLQGTSAVIILSRRLRRVMGYVLQEDCDLHVKLGRASAILSCWQEHKREVQKQFSMEWSAAFLTKPSGVQTRKNLIEAYRILWSDCSPAEVTRLSDDAISSYTAKDDEDHHKMDTEFNGECQQCIVPSELWPVMEVLSLRLGMTALAVLLPYPGKKSEEDSKVVVEAAEFFSQLPSTPLKLAAMYQTASCIKLQDGIIPEMIRWQLSHLMNSPACNNIAVKSAENLGQKVTSEADTNKVTFHLPHYSIMALHSWRLAEKAFAIDANGDILQNVSLSDYKEHCTRLEMLRAFLWKNAIAIDSSYLDITYYDALACKAAFNWFVDSLMHSLERSNSTFTSNLSVREKIDTIKQSLGIADPDSGGVNNLNTCLSLCESFEKIVQLYEELEQELSCRKLAVQTRITAKTSQLWFAMGQFQMSIFTHLGLVDPVKKRTMKLSYAREELECVERLLKAFEITARLQGRNWEVTPDAEVPPFIQTLRCLKAMLDKKCMKLEQGISTRSQNAQPFTLLRKEVENYKLNLHGKMEEIGNQLSEITQKLLRNSAQSGMTQESSQNRLFDVLNIRREANDVIDIATGMRESQQAFTDRLQATYGDHYPDLVTPLLVALTQVSYAIEVQCSVVHKLLQPDEEMWKLLCYPSIGTVYQSLSDIFLNTSSGSDWSFQQCMASLHDLGCLMSVMGNYNDNNNKIWAHLHNLLKDVVSIWKKQDDEKRLREEEKDALYVHKSAVHGVSVSEEQQNEEELDQLFPVWSSRDFSEFQPQCLEQIKPGSESLAFKDLQHTNRVLTEDDFYSVVKLHGSLVRAFTHSLWFQGSAKHYTPDFSKALLLRYEHMHEGIPNILQSQDSFVDSKLVASLLVLVTTESHENIVKKSDFYQKGQTEETARCLPVLRGIRRDVCKLLEQFPNFPTLSQMLIVVDRILGFPISSPLPRFLTGLELLLSKFEEWEQNAHQGVSLMEHRAPLTQLIFDWRRKELECWKSAFDAASARVETKATKWWFYIFSVIESFLSDEGERTSVPELEGTLKVFIENATLGDFETRLEILFSFHCYVLHMETSERQKVMLHLLWNLYKRFSQLKAAVAERLTRLRNPIERELRDFVKISHWKDTSYWAVREAITKSHRTVLKRIREFEKVLAEPALVAGVGVKAGGTIVVRFPTLSAAAFTMPLSWRNVFTTGDVLPHLESLFMKCRRRCRQLTERSEYSMLLSMLASVMNELFDRAEEDNRTEVNRSLPKEKQKSEAKHLLHRRRKTLTDVFHSLQLMGLSYRTGRLLSEDQRTSFSVLSPVDPVTALTSPDAVLSSTRDADLLIKQSWLGCENLFYCAEIHYEQLVGHLKSPAQDLGPANIDRLQGFAFHLLALVREQNSVMNISTKQLHKLRRIVMELSAHCQDTCGGVKPSEILHAKSRLVDILATVQMCMEQFRVTLKSCPSTSSPQVPHVWLSTKKHTPTLVSASYGDAEWRDSDALICDIVLMAGKLKAPLDVPVVKLKSVVEAYSGLQTVIEKIRKLQLKFEVDDTDFSRNPLAECLRWLSRLLHQELESFHQSSLFATVNLLSNRSGSQVLGIDSKTDDFMFDILSQVTKVHLSPDLVRDPTFRPKIKEILVKIMLVVQKLYKKNEKMSLGAGNDDACNTIEGATAMEEVESIDKQKNLMKNVVNGESSTQTMDTESHHELVKDHLKEKILGGLKTDINYLNLSVIIDTISDIQSMLINVLEVGKETKTSVYYKRLTQMLLPFLHQLSLLAELIVFQQIQAFHVSCQLVNRLLPLFQHLAQKGFGIPPDLMPDDEGEESGPAKGGMGLGDGEGETDVSERIESEDQLEDARPKGQEPEADDEKECKEESNGIETSEDFGGKAQDVDKNEDDEKESEDDNEEDLDAEMDDTTGAEEKLDKQVWGSDSEDENEEEMPEDDARGGEKEGEPELEAASGKRKRDSESDEEPGSGDEKRKQQRPEINEMDEPEPDDDQVDPYHGKQQPEPEPEAFDLPQDLQLDDGAAKDDAEANEENPFDIDEMKEQKEPEKENTDETSQEEKKNDDNTEEPESSSEDEMDNKEDPKKTAELDQEASDKEEENTEITKGEKDGKEGENEDQGNDQEEAGPSDDQPSHNAAEPAPEQAEAGSRDQVSAVSKENEKDSKDEGDAGDPGEMEQSGVGGAQMKDDQTGHQGRPEEASVPETQADQRGQRDARKRERPGQSDTQRSLGDLKEPTVKRLKTVDVTNKEQESKSEDETEEGADLGRSADLYQHIRDSKETFDAHTVDAATEEQAEKQPVPNLEEEKGEDVSDDDIEMIEDQPPASEKSPQERIPAENVPGKKDKSDHAGENMDTGGEGETNVEVEGERIETIGVKRGAETTFNTAVKLSESVPVSRQLIEEETRAIRQALEKQLGSWVQPPSDAEAERAWDSFSHTTQELARDLCEQLRLVLEPTQASRLRGDFRTGRRINMRKVIPYIASQFRKDKIWLRRTKPSKREYQIILGIDDSSSMDYNQAKEMTFESVALVSQALTLLEVGELGVVSFGEDIRVLHQLGQPFTHTSGAALLQHLRFNQRSTKVGSLVQFVTEMFENHGTRSSADRAQLLVILSDGRGVRSEGKLLVERAVGRARQERIFTVFIIIDNPKYETSILDVRNTDFSGGKVKFTSYMDDFPFPFYVVLRDVSALPAVLSDALRQWFELVVTIDS